MNQFITNNDYQINVLKLLNHENDNQVLETSGGNYLECDAHNS